MLMFGSLLCFSLFLNYRLTNLLPHCTFILVFLSKRSTVIAVLDVIVLLLK